MASFENPPHRHRSATSAQHDRAPHQHGIDQSIRLKTVSDARLLWSVVLNQALTVIQVAAGIVSGSTALLSDAAHNFNDANVLVITLVARRVARKQANRRYTFGYRRAETIGAVINLTLLGIIGLSLVVEGVLRLFRPVEIIGWLMAVAALLALIVDVATAILLWALSHGSLNVRSAFVHNLIDAFGSLAVLVGACAIMWLKWTWVDPAVTLLIAGYVLWQVWKLFPQATRILMEGAPEKLDLDELIANAVVLDGVIGLHHVHVWELDEHHRALEAHVVIDRDRATELESIKQDIKQYLVSRFQIHHSTLEFEYSSTDTCGDKAVITEH